MAEAPPLRGERKIFDPAFLRSHQGDSVCEGRPLAEIAAIDRAKIFNSFDQPCNSPDGIVTDKLLSYAAAFRRLRLSCPHEQGSGGTTEPKTRIRRCDDASASCSGSSRLDPPNAFSACTPPTTPSTSHATSSRGPHCGPSEPKLPPSSALLPRHPDPCRVAGSQCVLVRVAVTRPTSPRYAAATGRVSSRACCAAAAVAGSPSPATCTVGKANLIPFSSKAFLIIA